MNLRPLLLLPTLFALAQQPALLAQPELPTQTAYTDYTGHAHFPEQQQVELTAEERQYLVPPKVEYRPDGAPLHMPVFDQSLPTEEANAQYAQAKKDWIAQYPHEYYTLVEQGERTPENNRTWLTFYSEHSNQVVRQTWDPSVPLFMLYPIDSLKPKYYDSGNPYQDALFFKRRLQKWCYYYARATYNKHFEPIADNIDGYNNLSYLHNRFPIVLHGVSYVDFIRTRFAPPPPAATPTEDIQEPTLPTPPYQRHGLPAPKADQPTEQTPLAPQQQPAE